MTGLDEPDVRLPALAGVNLEATLFGGQAFRWRRDGERGAVGWIGSRPARVEASAEGLAAWSLAGSPLSEREAADYFDARRDYRAIERRLFRDATFKSAARGVAGVRILRQEAFETLVAFVVSSNNNIARIARSIEALSRIAGRRVETSLGPMWRFPEPEALAGVPVERLRAEANLGYRDRYVQESAARITTADVDLDAMTSLPTPELRDALMRLPGVGRKVADCVMLFAYGRTEVFPVDTWVRRAMTELYGAPDRPLTDREIAEVAARRFGADAGIAQQYLFEAYRLGAGRIRG